MFDPSQLSVYVNKDELISRLGEEAIYNRYSNDFPAQLCKSPFHTDRHESFSFYENDDKWMWKDLATGDYGDVFDFVQHLENCRTFNDTLHKICDDFRLQLSLSIKNNTFVAPLRESKPRKKSAITVERRLMSQFDLNLWAKWRFTPQLLEMYKIRSAENVWINPSRVDHNDMLLWASYTQENPIYYFKSEYTSNLKIYRPLSKVKIQKWRTNCTNDLDVQGYSQCRIKERPGQPLILTKSNKECGFFRSFGINAMAGHAEGIGFSKDFIRHLYKYCHPIISIYDSDPPGINGAMKLKKEFNIPYLFLCTSKLKSKDPTDRWVEDYKDFYQFLDRIQTTIEYYARRQSTPANLITADGFDFG